MKQSPFFFSYCRVLALALVLLSSPACAEVLEGLVVGVADGDTLTVLDDTKEQHRIRLSGIDAPEKRQPFGNVSRQHLADAVFQRRVLVEYQKTDRYGRIIGKVMLDGRDECLAQVVAGLAWHYKHYAREQPPEDRETYAAAEDAAKAARRGLWRDPDPVPPWEWRKASRASRGH